MLFRFCLYGFLKNQQYYDPFLILAFREKGLSFAVIGLLIGFREVCINVMEVPTGAIADVVGRRRSMIFAFLAYIGAFLIFALVRQVWPLFAAMLCFSIGEAFRTGTHKAMIFDYLARQGRANEKTKIYGFTRSWSKLGSALSVVIAGTLVFFARDYSSVFLYSIVPYALGIVNFLTYPAYLDGPRTQGAGVGAVARTLYESFRNSVRNPSLRRLFVESMCFDGVFRVCKDYAQPVIKATALAMPLLVGLANRQRTAVLIGGVYFVLYLASSYASRHADALVRRAGSERRGARWLWWMDLGVFALLAGAIGVNWLVNRQRDVAAAVVPLAIAIGAFVALSIIQNFWRPILVSRFAGHADPSQTATVLSIESQGKSLFTALLAPLLGLAVDLMPVQLRFWPVGLLGAFIAAIMLMSSSRRSS